MKQAIRKTFSLPRLCLLAMVLLLGSVEVIHAQTSKQDKKIKEQAVVKALVESQRFLFKAQSAMSMGGKVIQLDYGYDLKVGKDSINVYLPYFGRAYIAPLDASKGGLQFISTDFDYAITPGKKQGWEVVIKPKDYKEVQSMNLSISTSGYASLQVNCTDKQPISFTGIITEAVAGKQ